MGSPLVGHHGVDFVDDDRADVGEHSPAAFAGEQNVERLGRRHEDVRWLLHHLRSHVRRRVPGAHGSSDVDVVVAQFFEGPADPFERRLEVLVDVVAECFERRDIENTDAILQAFTQAALD